MLDTNTVSYLMRGDIGVAKKVRNIPMDAVCISVITEAELLYGLAKRSSGGRLRELVKRLLDRIDVLPWDREVAIRFGDLRAHLERKGMTLGPLDMQIAAHALAEAAVLVTNDRAFLQVPELEIENWVA
ncbi:type II toxin-antitoxin system VapC family toxin [Sulfidibacter corallicola]|uniref:Ribonuclease VapC n=2 Tax=Sulfidibacter corallicola TaxID=2818388 RepID=A0A8A4TY58_SULCO|nr:type II toxin-antitoxin system VapC family toxin [Sulfidibacter corallicola]QTD54267.1 type II toxin-antitoxin system VapC family toxin [Sulfidibacter corallicola]